ncbi:hypothetical protein L1987_32933 [Smallanthus sonchifolius]|uniref:Uncharacterized protein n=1 Tax=Smallanthus sonchifolius TaxID=185202 RepID=A0ACB9HPY2_9ASTR|nr:hypothetical protein L1987_32933 [Smallanthus sonchifolius]
MEALTEESESEILIIDDENSTREAPRKENVEDSDPNCQNMDQQQPEKEDENEEPSSSSPTGVALDFSNVVIYEWYFDEASNQYVGKRTYNSLSILFNPNEIMKLYDPELRLLSVFLVSIDTNIGRT